MHLPPLPAPTVGTAPAGSTGTMASTACADAMGAPLRCHLGLPCANQAGPCAAAGLQLDADGLLLDTLGTQAVLAAHAGVLTLQARRLRAIRQPERLEQALLLARAQGRWPLALLREQRLPLTLLCQRQLASGQFAGWHISLRDPEAARPDLLLVQALFGLTPSEAAVATALALGQSCAEIAQVLGVQPNTVLAHVKKALTKTGTQRQAQLVSLLLRSVAVVPAQEAAPGARSTRPAMPLARHPPSPGCGVAAALVPESCPSG